MGNLADAETVLIALRGGATLIKFEEPYTGIWCCYPFPPGSEPVIMCKASVVDALFHKGLLEIEPHPGTGLRLITKPE